MTAVLRSVQGLRGYTRVVLKCAAGTEEERREERERQAGKEGEEDEVEELFFFYR